MRSFASATVARARSLRRQEVDALKVRAGGGVLQQVLVTEGQQVTPGFNIARVADPASLKAVLRVPETQIKGVRIGQPVVVDTRNGLIQGRFRASTRPLVKARSRSTYR